MPKIVEDEKIYQAVLKVISENGYAGATTKLMAEAANVSEVTLFRKYKNKLQLVKQALLNIIKQTDFLAATQFSGNVNADLLHVVQAYQDSAVKYSRLLFMMFSEMSSFPEVLSLLDPPLEVFNNIRNLFAKYQSAGILQQENPVHAMSALFGPLIYTSMMQSAMPNVHIPPLDLQKHVTRYLEGRLLENQEN
ncbi:MAG: TetR/AcrR family transcriptional regulator [Anaerolineaceae bacterium]|nr:TetR/AcrR family transcriptional regulator [Anaerolineaceae bacterium]